MSEAKRSGRHRLADVCRQVGIQPYVLRYWESEFPALAEGKGKGGASRTYDDDELALIEKIKTLLYDEGYTIAGARRKLETGTDSPAPAPAPPAAKPRRRRAPRAASIDSPEPSGLNAARGELEAVLQELEGVLDVLR